MKTIQQNSFRTTRISTVLCVVTVLFACSPSALAQWATNGTNINNTNSGNVGVGTSTPAEKLHIFYGGLEGVGQIELQGGTNQAGFVGYWNQGGLIFSSNRNIRTGSNYNASFAGAQIIVGSAADGIRGDISFYTTSAGAPVTASELLRLKASGNVGIGTATPSSLFHIAGATRPTITTETTGTVAKGRFQNILPNLAGLMNNVSFDGANYNLDDTTKSGWALGMGAGNSDFWISHFTPGANPRTHNFRFYIGGSGNVGIGTATPGHRLDVQGGSVNASGGLCIAGDCKTAWSQIGGSQWTNGSGGAINYSGGNVGLGISSPAYKLDVAGEINATGLRINGAPISIGSSQWTTTGANISFASGNVGIGSNSPATKLDVLGTIRSGNADTNIGNHPTYGSAYAAFWRQGADYSLMTNGSHTFINSPVGGGNLYFRNGNVDKMVLVGSSGSLGIGTATPGHRLDVQGGSVNASGGLCIAGVCKTAWSEVGSSQWTTSGSNINYSAGNVGIGTTSPGSKLFVGGGTPAVATLAGLNVALGGNSYVSASNGTVNTYIGADTSSHGIVGTLSNHPLGLRANNALAVTILPNGNVGIGEPAPSKKLSVGGDLHATGKITGGNIEAKYQDVAEWVPSTQKLAAGTVVVLDTEHTNHVVASSSAYDTSVAGVVSEMPGLILGEAGDGKLMVATTGRVKVKVDATRAPIRIGDLLVTGEVPGVAMKSEPITVGGRKLHAPGTIIGKALEPLEKGVGEILVLLSMQ